MTPHLRTSLAAVLILGTIGLSAAPAHAQDDRQTDAVERKDEQRNPAHDDNLPPKAENQEQPKVDTAKPKKKLGRSRITEHANHSRR